MYGSTFDKYVASVEMGAAMTPPDANVFITAKATVDMPGFGIAIRLAQAGRVKSIDRVYNDWGE